MRVVGSALVGLSIAVALFLLMSQLIAGDSDVARRDNAALNLDFIRLNLDEIENIRRRTAPPPPDPVEPPETPRMFVETRPQLDRESFAEIDSAVFDADSVEFPEGIEMGRFGGGFALGDLSQDGEIFPLLQVTPIYPAAARLARQYGWVDLQYTVLIDGTVVDPVVIASEVRNPVLESVSASRRRPSQDIFNQAAIDAVLRTRFKPKVFEGKPVPVRVTQRFTFNVID